MRRETEERMVQRTGRKDTESGWERQEGWEGRKEGSGAEPPVLCPCPQAHSRASNPHQAGPRLGFCQQHAGGSGVRATGDRNPQRALTRVGGRSALPFERAAFSCLF